MSRKWHELSPRARGLILIVGAVEAALKLAALIDLARRPASRIRGSKLRWATSIMFMNSAGAVPILYFIWGRRR